MGGNPETTSASSSPAGTAAPDKNPLWKKFEGWFWVVCAGITVVGNISGLADIFRKLEAVLHGWRVFTHTLLGNIIAVIPVWIRPYPAELTYDAITLALILAGALLRGRDRPRAPPVDDPLIPTPKWLAWLGEPGSPLKLFGRGRTKHDLLETLRTVRDFSCFYFVAAALLGAQLLKSQWTPATYIVLSSALIAFAVAQNGLREWRNYQIVADSIRRFRPGRSTRIGRNLIQPTIYSTFWIILSVLIAEWLWIRSPPPLPQRGDDWRAAITTALLAGILSFEGILLVRRTSDVLWKMVCIVIAMLVMGAIGPMVVDALVESGISKAPG